MKIFLVLLQDIYVDDSTNIFSKFDDAFKFFNIEKFSILSGKFRIEEMGF